LQVREYESSASLFAESRAKRSELADSLKECEGELAALRQEMDVQRQILDKLREAERRVDAEVEEIIGERRRCKELVVGCRGRGACLGASERCQAAWQAWTGPGIRQPAGEAARWRRWGATHAQVAHPDSPQPVPAKPAAC
jgi:hypothetical protein